MKFHKLLNAILLSWKTTITELSTNVKELDMGSIQVRFKDSNGCEQDEIQTFI